MKPKFDNLDVGSFLCGMIWALMILAFCGYR